MKGFETDYEENNLEIGLKSVLDAFLVVFGT